MISVIGAGAFGTALAISLARGGQNVVLWARDAAQVDAMRAARENAARLPGMVFPGTLMVTKDATTLPDGPVLLSVPIDRKSVV